MTVEDGERKHSMHCLKTNEWFCNNEYKHVLDSQPPAEQDDYSYQRQKQRAPKGVKETVKCRLYSDQILKHGRWPPNSQNLNLIEHIWGWIEKKLGELDPITDL